MKKPQARNWLMIGIGLSSTLLLGATSCASEDGGLLLPAAGTSGSGASGGSLGESGGAAGDSTGEAGANEAAGNGGGSAAASGTGGKANGKGGTSGAQAGKGGTGSDNGGGSSGEPEPEAGAAGVPSNGGSSGSGGSAGGENQGEAGAGGATDPEPLPLCIFHSDPAPATGGGEGGAPAAVRGIEVATSAFVGPYLTDLAGMTLYIYGADVPGDCNNPPVSNCSADCAISWPVFDAGERTLDETLDPSVFGTIDRGDGTYQTTYYGWPLYYYKSDTAPNTINGQGKGKTWYAAEVSLPNLMIMRGPVSGGGIKYLSDDRGYTLYALSGDTLGGSGTPPVSACSGDCLASFLPYAPGQVYPVTTIEPHDVALFFRNDGALQTAYKGAPLYYSTLDLRPGEQNGINLFGGALVAP